MNNNVDHQYLWQCPEKNSNIVGQIGPEPRNRSNVIDNRTVTANKGIRRKRRFKYSDDRSNLPLLKKRKGKKSRLSPMYVELISVFILTFSAISIDLTSLTTRTSRRNSHWQLFQTLQLRRVYCACAEILKRKITKSCFNYDLWWTLAHQINERTKTSIANFNGGLCSVLPCAFQMCYQPVRIWIQCQRVRSLSTWLKWREFHSSNLFWSAMCRPSFHMQINPFHLCRVKIWGTTAFCVLKEIFYEIHLLKFQSYKKAVSDAQLFLLQ